MTDDEFQALLSRYMDGFDTDCGHAPLSAWGTHDLVRLAMAVDQELERRNLERHRPDGQYDDYCG